MSDTTTTVKRVKRGPIPLDEKLRALHDSAVASVAKLREREERIRQALVAITAQRENAESHLLRYRRALDDAPAATPMGVLGKQPGDVLADDEAAQ